MDLKISAPLISTMSMDKTWVEETAKNSKLIIIENV